MPYIILVLAGPTSEVRPQYHYGQVAMIVINAYRGGGRQRAVTFFALVGTPGRPAAY